MADILLATDADWVVAELRAAVEGPDLAVRSVRRGEAVPAALREHAPDLVVLDLQIGNMGGMATCVHLHLEAEAGRLPAVPVLMLLDRRPDVFLARRSGADGFIMKPLDAIRLRKAVRSLLGGQGRSACATGSATVPEEGRPYPRGYGVGPWPTS